MIDQMHEHLKVVTKSGIAKCHHLLKLVKAGAPFLRLISYIQRSLRSSTLHQPVPTTLRKRQLCCCSC